jgi:hypothetical protein
MATTDKDKQRQGLIRKYHTLCGKLGLTDDARREMLRQNYGVESSKELYTEELTALCAWLHGEVHGAEGKLQEARRRVFGAVGGWLDMVYGKVPESDKARRWERVQKIKAIACRQTRYDDFMKIPPERLANVSFLFSKKQKDMRQGEATISEELKGLAGLN